MKKLLLTLLLTLNCSLAFAAISANAVWDVRSSADAGNAGGGFFVTGASGTDYSKQNSPQYALTGVTSAGAGNTILTASAATDMVGNGLRVVSGTNFTQSWFEITSVVAGVSITVSTNAAGTAITTGVGAAGVVNIGGALSLGASGTFGDDAVFEQMQGGNKAYVKNGTYTIGENISVAATSATITNPIFVEGYNSTQADNPTGSSRPTWTGGANTLAFGATTGYWYFKNLIITTTEAAGLDLGSANSGGFVENCKVTNTSTTTGRVSISPAGNSQIFNSEIVSQNGNGISSAGDNAIRVIGSYLHDSVKGHVSGASNRHVFFGNIFEANTTSDIEIGNTTNAAATVVNNIFYGSEAKLGTGFNLTGSATGEAGIYNNIFYGKDTGVSANTTNKQSNYENYNDFNNNTTNRTLFNTGVNSITTAPSFAGASQLTGTTATTSGSVLTQSGGDFSTVTDNIDYLHVTSGTGVTTGIYLITSHTSTTLTVNNALGTSSGGDVVWFVPVGHNFRIGANLKATGFPGAVNSNSSESTGYLDMGALQRQEGTGIFVQ